MTTQVKTYIETTDIIGLRLQCKQCGCSLTLGTEKEEEAVTNLLGANNQMLERCPACRAPWNESNNTAVFDSEVKDLFRRLQSLKKIEQRLGYSISFEIKPYEDE